MLSLVDFAVDARTQLAVGLSPDPRPGLHVRKYLAKASRHLDIRAGSFPPEHFGAEEVEAEGMGRAQAIRVNSNFFGLHGISVW